MSIGNEFNGPGLTPWPFSAHNDYTERTVTYRGIVFRVVYDRAVKDVHVSRRARGTSIPWPYWLDVPIEQGSIGLGPCIRLDGSLVPVVELLFPSDAPLHPEWDPSHREIL